jgi:probable addiction module antidote protein
MLVDRVKTAIYIRPVFELVKSATFDSCSMACAEEAPNDAAFMLKALGTVARARNMSQLAEATGMTRAGLYKALSGKGNPSLANTMKVAKALGYRLALVPDRD